MDLDTGVNEVDAGFAAAESGNARSVSPPSQISRLTLPNSCQPPSEQNPAKQLIWIVYGATGHMGRSLVRTALSNGDRVTAVAWSQEHSKEEMERWSGDNVLWMRCDVRIKDSVEAVMGKSLEHWGRVDLIANCVGFGELSFPLVCSGSHDFLNNTDHISAGVIGACEDQDECELRNQFDINFFGTLHIIQISLPYFRSQNRGRYLIFSSTSGALGVPGLGPYCATKYAVEGLMESMLYEVDCYNIKATLVQPGHVRRDEPEDDPHSYGDQGIKFVKPPTRFSAFKVMTASPPYAGPNAPAGHAKRMLAWLNDRQPTSAVKSAELVWQLGHCKYPPLRLLLGTFAVDSIRDRLKSIVEEIEDWKHLHFPVVPSEQEQKSDDQAMAAAEEEQEDDGEGDDDVKEEDE